MDVEPGSDRARVVEASYLTIVGSPGAAGEGHGQAQANASQPGQGQNNHANANGNTHRGGHRHNVYNVWLTPKTEVCDQATANAKDKDKGQANSGQDAKANANASGNNANANAKGNSGAPNDLNHLQADLDKLEVGDRVEVVFQRRDTGKNGNSPQSSRWSLRHGRNRVYFGDATKVTILAGPNAGQSSAASPGDHGRRDDDRDKTGNGNTGDNGSRGASQPSDAQKK